MLTLTLTKYWRSHLETQSRLSRHCLLSFWQNSVEWVWTCKLYHLLANCSDALFSQTSKNQIKVDLVDENFTELKGEIAGPPDTPYEGQREDVIMTCWLCVSENFLILDHFWLQRYLQYLIYAFWRFNFQAICNTQSICFATLASGQNWANALIKCFSIYQLLNCICIIFMKNT